jgi:membrane-associated protease RseP (regulator of RpoE activity)
MRKITLLAVLFAAALGAPGTAHAQETHIYVMPTSRGMMGIFSETITVNGVTEIVIRDVVPGSPAAKAGIRPRDVVIRIDGTAASAELLRAPREPGQTVRLRLRRGSEERDVEVVTVERQERDFRVMTALPDSVLGQMAIIMNNVQMQLDSMGRITNHINMDSLRILLPDSLRRMSFPRDSLMRYYFRGDSAGWRMPEGGSIQIYRRANVDSLRAHFDSLFINFEAARPAAEALHRLRADSATVFMRPSDIVRTAIFTGLTSMAGAELSTLNPGLAEYFGSAEGVLVLNVQEGTPAARADLRAGDVIVAVNGTTVRNIADIRRAAPGAGETITLAIQRKGQRLELRL